MRHDKNAILDRWAAGETATQIAAEMNLPRPQTAYVIVSRARAAGDARAMARHRAATSHYVTVYLPERVLKNLTSGARRRNITVIALCQMLLSAAADDGLCDAILDDGA